MPAVLALALVPGATGAVPGVRLPRDHLAHPAAGIEWWYVTGLVHGNDGHRYSWDWFSCRFDDWTELMLYRFRDRQGRPLRAYRNGTYVQASGRSRPVTGFDVRAGDRVLEAAGHRWPLDWRVDVPSLHIEVRLRSIVSNQLFRGVLVPTFWEGAATASGTKTGICFVEETYS